MAILKATELVAGHVSEEKEISVNVESQVVRKALKELYVKSRLVSECRKATDLLAEKYKV